MFRTRPKIHKCQVCDMVVEVLEQCGLELACCGRPMARLQEKLLEEGKDLHSPLVERLDSGIKVRVSHLPHPMEGDHYVEWIEVLSGGRSFRHFLQPGDPPEAVFDASPDNVVVRTYCSVHGLWRSGRSQRELVAQEAVVSAA